MAEVKATLINATGDKKVVVAGSPEASALFKQGYNLMGAPNVAKTPPVMSGAPAGTAPLNPAPGTLPTAPNQPATDASAPSGSSSAPATDPTRKATLYGPAGERVVVTGGSAKASELMGRGFTLTPDEARSKKKATLFGPNGERRVVFADSQEAKDLQAKGYTLTQGGAGSVITNTDAVRAHDRNEAYEAFKDNLTGGKEAPAPPDLLGDYNKYRDQYGLPGLETGISEIDRKIDDLDASFRQGNENARNELAPMETISGTQRELEFQYQEKRDLLRRERDSLVTQQSNAVNTISTIMGLTQQSWDNASSAYNSEYSRNVQTWSLFNEEQDRVRRDAQANLTTITNMAQESGKGWNDFSPDMRRAISAMETQSGLPPGTFRDFMATSPGKLLTTVNGTDAAGNDIVSFVYQDKNGNPSIVRTVRTGGYTKPSGSGSDDDEEKPTELESIVDEAARDIINIEKANGGQSGASYGSTVDAIVQATSIKNADGSFTPTISREAVDRLLISRIQQRKGERPSGNDNPASDFVTEPAKTAGGASRTGSQQSADVKKATDYKNQARKYLNIINTKSRTGLTNDPAVADARRKLNAIPRTYKGVAIHDGRRVF